jgi:hypothetical protein
MHRAMEAILMLCDIKEEILKGEILKGEITSVILYDLTNYTKGPVLIGHIEKDWVVVREIISVRHTYFREVTVGEYMGSGFVDSQEMYKGLKNLYPNTTWNSLVTVVKWE